MTLSNSIFAVSGAATFLDARKDMSNLFACDTSLEPHPGLLTVGGSSAANGNVVVGMSNRMAVTVRPFQAVLNRLGALLIMNDGDVVVPLQAAPSANSRIDVVYVKQRERRAPISDSEDGPIIGVVTGAANLTPTAPQVPDGAVALAQVKVPSGVTNTTAGGVVITQVYPFAATRGEELRFRTKGDMDGFAALDGTKAVTLSDNAHYVRNGGAWQHPWLCESCDVFTANAYTNSNNWFEITFNSRATKYGATDNVELSKFGNINCCRILKSGWYALTAFLNVAYSGSKLENVCYRTYSGGKWTAYINSVVTFSRNEWSGYTSLPIPVEYAYIPAGTVITLGLSDDSPANVGGATRFTVTKIG